MSLVITSHKSYTTVVIDLVGKHILHDYHSLKQLKQIVDRKYNCRKHTLHPTLKIFATLLEQKEEIHWEVWESQTSVLFTNVWLKYIVLYYIYNFHGEMVMAQLVRKRKKDTKSCPITHLYFTSNRAVKIVFPESDSVQSSIPF